MTPEEKLKSLLRELFQVDHSDLDFGIYRIMRLRRGEVEEFLEKRLPARLEEVRSHLAARGAEAVRAELEELRPQLRAAYGTDFESRLEKFRGAELAERWLELSERLADARVANETVNEIYNHLYAFFDRYYDDGDFLPKPRSSGYRIPYDGSDVVLHWATKDMYYIKTGENFKSYAFDNGLTGNERTRCEFRIRDAETPLNNNKAESGRAYIPSGSDYVEWGADTRTLILRFEYRKPTDEEAATWGKSNRAAKKGDATINDRVVADLDKRIPKFKDPYLDRFLISDRGRGDEKTRTFLYHLNRYTTLNQFDYFIHKNLRKFLETELDQYLKDHVLGLAFLNPDWNERDVEKAVRRNVVRAGCIRDLAMAIIGMLSDLEEFQKRLFLKKKYVIRSDYCMTLDLVPEDVREDLIHEILSDADARQLRNWHELGFLFESPLLHGEKLRQGKALRSADVRRWVEAHDKLVVDTALVSEEMKWRILCGIDELDEKCGGLLINSENLQGLRILETSKFEGMLYCDPPYNSGDSGFPFKDGFSTASWIALINQAVVGGQRPLSGSGLAAFSIGDKDELNRTSHVLTGILDTAIGSERWLNTFSVETANQSETTFTVRNKEYLIAYSLGTTAFVPLFAAKPQLGRCTTSNEDQTQPEIDFPSGIRCEGLADGLYAQEDLQDPNSLENIFLIEPSTLRVKNGRTTHGIRMRARWSNSGDLRKYFSGQSTKTKFGKEIVEVYFSKGPRARRLSVMMRKEGFEKPTSIMRFTQAGSRPLISMFGKEVRSLSQRLHPKPLSLLRWIVGMSQPQAMVIDPFGGSGVTGEAVLDLNRRDGSQRRYTLIEMADYFHTVLKPRIQKVMFSAKWKNGRPVLDPEAAARIPETGADDENGDDDSVDDDDVNGTEPEANGDVYGGVTHMFQYLNLEQYEDTLNNIVFTDSPQNILGNDPAEVRAAIGELFPEEERLSYYFTEGSWMSPSLGLSDLIRDPFSARLKITEQNEPKDTSIDPIATFNFLLGLRVRRYVVTEQQGRRVVIVFGRKDTEEHVLIWRKCDDTWDPDVERAWVQEQDWFKTSTVWTNGHNSFGGNRIEPELKRLMFEDVD